MLREKETRKLSEHTSRDTDLKTEKLATVIQLRDPNQAPKDRSEIHSGGYASEAEFVEGLRRQETQAFNELCRRHLRRVRIVLFRVLGNDPELSDLVQEVIIRAIGSAPAFRGEASQLGAWLAKITVFTARDTIRKRRVFHRFFHFMEDDADAFPAKLTSVEQREKIRRLYRVLDKLPTDERIAFTLRYVDEMKVDEVADVCKVSPSTAKRWTRKGKERFERLAERDPELRTLLTGGES